MASNDYSMAIDALIMLQVTSRFDASSKGATEPVDAMVDVFEMWMACCSRWMHDDKTAKTMRRGREGIPSSNFIQRIRF